MTRVMWPCSCLCCSWTTSSLNYLVTVLPSSLPKRALAAHTSRASRALKCTPQPTCRKDETVDGRSSSPPSRGSQIFQSTSSRTLETSCAKHVVPGVQHEPLSDRRVGQKLHRSGNPETPICLQYYHILTSPINIIDLPCDFLAMIYWSLWEDQVRRAGWLKSPGLTAHGHSRKQLMLCYFRAAG